MHACAGSMYQQNWAGSAAERERSVWGMRSTVFGVYWRSVAPQLCIMLRCMRMMRAYLRKACLLLSFVEIARCCVRLDCAV